MTRLWYLSISFALLCISVAFIVGLAGYVGFWVCYVGSVVDFINQCKATTTDAWAIAVDMIYFFVGGALFVSLGLTGGAYAACGAMLFLIATFSGNKKKG